jgi:hypothetical protein
MNSRTDRGQLQGNTVCPCGRSFRNFNALGIHGRRCASMTPEVRFWLKVDKSGGPDACWPWQGAITSHGYGCVAWGGTRDKTKVIGAHKAAYLYAKGPVPDGLEIMHACDYRPCCNPAHLGVGKKQDNSDDKMRKGRGLKGMSWHDHIKLTAADALEIRRLQGIEQSGVLAKRYGVCQPHIINIWNRKVWRSLP